MSDDEGSGDVDVKYTSGKGIIHYGSLADQEAARLKQLAAAGLKKEEQATGSPPAGSSDGSSSSGADVSDSEDVGPPGEAEHGGNIFKSSGETMEMEVQADPQAELREMFERRRRARELKVPTADVDVKVLLRELDEPTCLFGEDAADRRQRLRDLLAEQGEGISEALAARMAASGEAVKIEGRKDAETWYHEGPQSLAVARKWIATYSIPRAAKRLAAARILKAQPESTRIARVQEVQKFTRQLTNSCSQIGDTRPVTYCRVSPNSRLLATASYTGLCKLWTTPDCCHVRSLRGHVAQASCIVWHPGATINMSDDSCCLASCAHDGSVKLWSLDSEEPIADIEGHAPHRVSRVEFHPSGRFLATCVFDGSWRLWDLAAQEEILHQEGHAGSVYDIAFHDDGSLAATAGLDAYARVWDIRTGRCVMFMEGHLKHILAIDFNINGFHVATGSEDNTIKIWDLRQRKTVYTIPAHTNLISGVKFDTKHNGRFLISSSYDHTAKVWAHPGWTPLKTLSGHENKVMCVDSAPSGDFLVTASYDRTFKIWSTDL